MEPEGKAAAISAREAEVLALVGDHRSNAEIAAHLYISVRTVETHVSSLLRKLAAADRRALADIADDLARAEQVNQVRTELPSALSPFIGRSDERKVLRDVVRAHRLVTAVGPGGIGKTRLALTVAADLAGDFPDGVWFVDLVPVTDPTMVGATVAGAIGVGERQGGDLEDSALTALANRRTLLVLDNCEHLSAGVTPFVERLLTRCPGVTVLATSRARLMVPFERAYSVPPMSLDGGADSGDATTLFVERATAVGWAVKPDHLDQVADVCRKLDGVALAIELAAARLPALGLDGLIAGLSDHLRLLVGGYRADDRHRSVRAMLDWSQALLTGADLALLRRVSVFVSPFTASDASAVAGFSPLDPDQVVDGLARLSDQSLLSVTVARDGSARYRALETIRQYGREQLTDAGEDEASRSRHLRWCLGTSTTLADAGDTTTGDWRTRFDSVADDLRAALGWAADRADHRGDASRLALVFARLAFARTLVGESQQRYEQAASLAADPADEAAALRLAASVAACRMRGEDAYRLWHAAADCSLRADNSIDAARDLATAVTTYFRKFGTFADRPPSDEVTAQLTRARDLASDDPAARAAVVLADCAALGFSYFAEQSRSDRFAAEMTSLAGRAVDMARQFGDPLVECAALQALTGSQRLVGDTFAAAATARRRVELISAEPVTPAVADELIDALQIATATSIGVGDLVSARRWGQYLRDLPLLAEVGHVATSRIIMADALAGHATDVVRGSGRFLDAWTQAGSPAAPGLGPVAAAVAMIHGLRGDRAARAEWLVIVDRLGVTPDDRSGYSPTFDAIMLLHEGDAASALDLLDPSADEPARWTTGVLQHWHVALRAEAAVLSGHPDAARHLAEARTIVAGNAVADAIVDRARALHSHDREGILATAAAFGDAGCPYQHARTLVLAAPDAASAGLDALAALGIGRR